MYDNIKEISVSSEDVWRSDFALYNADLSFGIGSCHETSCLIEAMGNVTCVEPCTYVGHCRSDYTLWPYDRQNCTMVCGPWMSNEYEIDYASKGTFVSSGGTAQNNEWKLVSANGIKKYTTVVSKDSQISFKFPNLYYSFLIERHTALISRIIGGESFVEDS